MPTRTASIACVALLAALASATPQPAHNATATIPKRGCSSEQECLKMKKERRNALKPRASPVAPAPAPGSPQDVPINQIQAFDPAMQVYTFQTYAGQTYSMAARGAPGGDNPTADPNIVGGNGAQVSGIFAPQQDTLLYVIVGTPGQDSVDNGASCMQSNPFATERCGAAGGGGMSAFYTLQCEQDGNCYPTPLLVAAGGGGASEVYNGFYKNGGSALILEDANAPSAGQGGSGQPGTNCGVVSSDSTLQTDCRYTAGGGSGFFGSGGNGGPYYSDVTPAFGGSDGFESNGNYYFITSGGNGFAFHPGNQFANIAVGGQGGDVGGGGGGQLWGGGGAGYMGGSVTDEDGAFGGTSYISPQLSSPGFYKLCFDANAPLCYRTAEAAIERLS